MSNTNVYSINFLGSFEGFLLLMSRMILLFLIKKVAKNSSTQPCILRMSLGQRHLYERKITKNAAGQWLSSVAPALEGLNSIIPPKSTLL